MFHCTCEVWVILQIKTFSCTSNPQLWFWLRLCVPLCVENFSSATLTLKNKMNLEPWISFKKPEAENRLFPSFSWFFFFEMCSSDRLQITQTVRRKITTVIFFLSFFLFLKPLYYTICMQMFNAGVNLSHRSPQLQRHSQPIAAAVAGFSTRCQNLDVVHRR